MPEELLMYVKPAVGHLKILAQSLHTGPDYLVDQLGAPVLDMPGKRVVRKGGAGCGDFEDPSPY